jgi:signal transduction histidine kinase
LTPWSRRYRGRLGAELVLAFLAGAIAFVLASLLSAAARSHVPGVVLAGVFLLAILAVAHYGGLLYALPVGVVIIEAFDWFFLPPLRILDRPTVFLVALVLAASVLVGATTSRATRRAAASEGARGVLAGEQAALRRVATLVAQGVPRSDVFAAVAREVGGLFGSDFAGMVRYETDTVILLATWAAAGEGPEVGAGWPLESAGPAAKIWRTGRPARLEHSDAIPARLAVLRDQHGVRSSVGSPIVVEGRLWGALLVHSKQADPLPGDTESRLANFTELVATAISNAQARAEARRLADEQAALRRVATLVARESSPGEVFAAVGEEVGRLLDVDDTRLVRYEPDGTATVVANWGERCATVPVGTRLGLEADDLASLVLRTERPARMDQRVRPADGPGASAPHAGVGSAVASPIVVNGRPWGAMIAASRECEPLPAGTESRMGEFTELVATAISNIQARSDLAASGARIVAATDAERRRVVRDLHDGAQQRLVQTVITLQLALRALQDQRDDAPALVTEALEHAEEATVELRELAHGILPSVLTRGGLRAGVEALASRTPLPVEIHVSGDRFPAPVEATAYFLVSEALTNVTKHARAEHAAVTASVDDGSLRVEVRDDGVGGARLEGSGLVGLADRIAVLHGRLGVESPTGGGTLLSASIPLGTGP